jgi:hypothetical protein
MHELIKKLAEGEERPLSPVDIIRRSLEEAQARKTRPDMPILFDDDALLLFYKHKDRIEEYLKTEDAQDIIKLLVDSFREYSTHPGEAEAKEAPVTDPEKA